MSVEIYSNENGRTLSQETYAHVQRSSLVSVQNEDDGSNMSVIYWFRSVNQQEKPSSVITCVSPTVFSEILQSPNLNV